MNETIFHPNHPRYQIEISHVEGPTCPFLDGDCEPPVLAFYDRSIDGYASGERDSDAITVPMLLHCIPLYKFGRRKFREEIADAIDCYLDTQHNDTMGAEVALLLADGQRKTPGHWRDAYIEAWHRIGNAEPGGWNSAEKYFETLEALCALAGIVCLHDISRGYCQGHATHVFVACTPEWAEKVGSPKSNHANECQYAFDAYEAWAWGDVWQIDRITDPQSDELGEDSTGQPWPPGGEFLGDDHAKSGLLETASEYIGWHEDYLIAEARESADAACRDIATDTHHAWLSRIFPIWTADAALAGK